MKTIDHWLSEYGLVHRHPINVLIHKIAVPAIVFSLFGLLWSVPALSLFGISLNWSITVVIPILVYYFFLSPPLAVGMVMWAIVQTGLYYWFDEMLGWPLGWICLIIFGISWVLQFVGHSIEGQRPSFLEDLRFLLIGPLWILRAFYKRLGIFTKNSA